MTSLWKSKFRQGSFRGVPFQTRSHSKTGGRRIQGHEFPQVEENRTEDLGRKLAKFSLDMYVIADDYFPARDALEAALNKKGPGELIHPYLGRMTVQAGVYTLSETVEEGRMARFTVNFSEAGSKTFPEQFVDSITSVTSTANEMTSSARSTFEDIFTIANTPAFVVQSAANAVNNVTTFMDTAVKKVTQPVANLTFAIRNLETAIEDLISRPGELAQIMSNMFDTLVDEFENTPEIASSVLSQFKNLKDEFEVVVGDTPSRNQERINQNAVIALAEDLAFANHAKTASQTIFTSSQQALAERDEIITDLDNRALTLADSAGDDDLYQNNKDVQAALTRAIPQPGLAEQITFTPQTTLPALVLVHQLFGNVDKEQELIDQNDVQHPGFVPIKELEVSNG